ncbi:GNAT family N-acetyltransferase [candidate division KSB1 bacterium]
MSENRIHIVTMNESHWGHVLAIYNEGLATGNATFETEVPDWNHWNTSFKESCRLVAESSGQILGWAALKQVSHRDAYAGVCEVSIYIREKYQGREIGKKLLKTLVAESEKNGIWTLQASVFPENQPSIALFEKCGFREVGRREKLGRLNGVWRDVILFERRSTTVL